MGQPSRSGPCSRLRPTRPSARRSRLGPMPSRVALHARTPPPTGCSPPSRSRSMLGMLLDQQVPMEWAFTAPLAVEGAARRRAARRDRDRGDGPGRARGDLPRQAALHRYPGSMAKRTQALCAHLVEHYGGRADGSGRMSRPATSCSPGCSRCPASARPRPRIFVGLLGKRLGVRPPGWEAVAADWPSIADVDSFERVLEIREQKQAMKAAAKAGPSLPRN